MNHLDIIQAMEALGERLCTPQKMNTKESLLRLGIDIRTDGEKFRDKVQKEWERRMNDRNK